MNQTDKPIAYRLFIGNQETSVNIPAHAIQTLVY
jgi:glucosylceramidase